jgi:hypothetical protein
MISERKPFENRRQSKTTITDVLAADKSTISQELNSNHCRRRNQSKHQTLGRPEKTY